MKYVFDNNTLTSIFKHYYFQNFPSFWDKFDPLVISKEAVSTKEVRRELEAMNRWQYIKVWANKYPYFFSNPTGQELAFIPKIYSVKHFQQNIENKKLLGGLPVADPFIIARAQINNAIVVTEEKLKKNASKIPNICAHFGIKCIDLQGFLTSENWKF